jgi:hypothetical protein
VGGPELKAVSAVGDVAKGVKITEDVSEVGRAGSVINDVAKSCPLNSFTADTPVLMADGSKKAIKDVRVGDQVTAGDAQAGREVPERVQRVIVGHGVKHISAIEVAGETIKATYNHPIWVVDDARFEWANQIVPGEHLWLDGGHLATVTKISSFVEVTTVYNLSVLDVHTFFVGSSPVLVHNAGCINASPKAVNHVLETHFEGGAAADIATKSIFAGGQDFASLLSRAETVAPYVQKGGNLVREVFAEGLAGFERGTGQGTMFYTVVTTPRDALVTMFPGFRGS